MENKHTKGPWICEQDFVYALHHKAGYKRGSPLMENRFFLHIQGNDMNEGEPEANARLIAAAPELLEALESISSRYWSLCEGGTEDAVIYAKAKAAISKAKGL